MTTPQPTDDRLYRLLPAIYRIRDAAQGEPLRALLAIIQQELQVVEADIDALYDNWFIETCDNWVVPYLGDLLDVGELDVGVPVIGTLNPEGEKAYGQQERRAYVANTLAYRRRKGTMPVLEQLTQDVTGWRSRAVEFGSLVNTTQNLDRLRSRSTTVNLRANDGLNQIGTPFEEQAAYSVEVRPVTQGGRYNVPNVGLYVWRLQSYPLERVQARAVPGPESPMTGQYYTFNPVGSEQVPLFNQPQTKANITALASEINVPAILRRLVLADELARSRQLRRQGETLRGSRYFDTDPVIAIFLNGQTQPLPPEALLITDLVAREPAAGVESTDETLSWPTPATLLWDEPTAGDETAANNNAPENLPWPTVDTIPWNGNHARDPIGPPAYLAAVDPERGRFVLRPGLSPTKVEVSYFYGFSGDVGGGTYRRLTTLPPELAETQLPISPWHWPVQQANQVSSNSLTLAIEAWNRTVMARYGLRQKTHIPLAIVTVPPIQVAKVIESQNETRPLFKPGRVRGLEVVPGICPNSLEVRSGLAIDASGQRLNLALPWCFDVVSRFAETIAQLPDRTGILVLFYQPTERGNSVDLALMTEKALNAYPPGTLFPLAKLGFDDNNQLQSLVGLKANVRFQPGILQGLDVYTRPGTLETLIRPGTAVDAQGNVLVLVENYPVSLVHHQGQEPRLIAVPSMRGERRIQLVSQDELNDLSRAYILLARLEVPKVKLGGIETDPKRIGRDLTITKTELGLTPQDAGIQVAAGIFHLPSGQSLTLKAPQHIDLGAYAGRTLVLFLSEQPNQGWPLTFTSPPGDDEDVYLGLIPIAPPAGNGTTDPLGLEGVDTGWIAIQDNATYAGDLLIAVPPNAQLHIVAADGYRPHVQGNIAIQGWTEAGRAEGELTLNGLLVEGALRVLPGSLGGLSLHHCTLVPQSGGILVYGEETEDTEEDGNNFSLLAFVAYCLTTLWQLIRQDLGIKTTAPPMTMAQFLQTNWQQLMAGMAAVLSSDRSTGKSLPWGDIALQEVDNNRLEINLYRTITGPLHLTDSVPVLQIEGSIIDKGQTFNSSAIAIAAPGTAINIRTTTVLGRTTARQLDANDCLFTEKVTVWRHQEGCVRFSYVPVASSTPSRYRCQPDLALQQALQDIPRGIACLGVISPSADNPYSVFSGTAGDGIFWLTQNSREEQSTATWGDVTGDLPNRTLTALATYHWPQTPLPETELAQRAELLVGTATGEIFRLINPTFAQTASFPTSANPNHDTDWRRVPLPVINGAITGLYPEEVMGTGSMTLTHAPPEPSPGQPAVAQCKGQDTRFSQELQQGDVILVDAELWRVQQLGRPSGSRTISLKGRIARGQGHAFSDDLKVGDTITIERQLRTGGQNQTIAQTRTIMALSQTEEEAILTLNAAFGSVIFAPDQAHTFIINIDKELTVKAVSLRILQPRANAAPQSEAATTATNIPAASAAPPEPAPVPFKLLHLWAITNGSGIWRGAIDGQSWQPWNAGLTNLSLTTVGRDSQQRLWVGTTGAGVFQLTQSPSAYRWQAVNQGLTTGYVTHLLVSPGNHLLAATDDGIFSFNADQKTWHGASDGLTTADITFMAADRVVGTLQTQEQTVKGINTFFLQQGLKPGDQLNLDGQSHEIEQVLSDTSILLKTPFSPPLRANTEFQEYDLVIAGSRDGKLFRSIDGGQTWQPLGLDFRGTDVSALVIKPGSGNIWLGTAAGEVLRSPDYGNGWQSIQRGRSDLATKLQIIGQMQPVFTTTRYGEPGYVQLRETCPMAIRTGAENGAEFGTFNYLRQPQREANLTASLDEYLRFGLAAGIFYMT